MLTTAYLRSREYLKDIRRSGKKEDVTAGRRIMNAAKQKVDVHNRTCKLCGEGGIPQTPKRDTE
jgi:cytochrome c5